MKIQFYSFFNLGCRQGWVVNATTRPLYPRETDRVPTVQTPGCTTRTDCTGEENLASTGIRSQDRPAPSQSVYRLRYPAQNQVIASPFLPTTEVPTCKVVPYTPRTCRGGQQRGISTQSEPKQFLSLIAKQDAHTHTPNHPSTKKKSAIYAQDKIDIRRHKETRNSYKHDLQAPPSTRRIRDNNTNSVPSSVYHNL